MIRSSAKTTHTPAKVIGEHPCDTCKGTGVMPEYDWPQGCEAESALKLRSYWSGGQHWLCDQPQHYGFIPVLWTPADKARALEAIGQSAS